MITSHVAMGLPLLLLAITLMIVGVLNMIWNLKYAFDNGNILYIIIIGIITAITASIGWVLGGLIG